ncbi:MAG: sigma 54-interacting transcriptional regulator, partial [Desulfovibrionaceae bacterium]
MNHAPHTSSARRAEIPALWIDPEGRVVEANDAFCRAAGLDRAEVVGALAADLGLTHPGQEGQTLLEVLRSGGAVEVSLRAASPDGVPATIQGAACPVADAELALCLFPRQSAQADVRAALTEGERNLRAVLDATADTVALIDRRGRILDINVTGARRFGKDREELLGVDVFSFFPAPLAASRKKRLRQAVDLGRTERFMDSREGSIFENHLYPVPGADGRVERVAVYVRDVTARFEAEEAARTARRDKEAYRRNLEAIFSSIPVGVVLVDESMRLMEANEAARLICGALSPSSGGFSFNADCPGACRVVLEQVLSRRDSVSEYRAECSACQGGPRVLNLNGSLVGEAGQQVQGAVLVIRDATRVAEMERKLRQRAGWRNMVGVSEAMQRVYELLDQLMEVDASVLVVGESGTGKELVAEALHYGGPRAAGPLIKVNCSALSESLLESELFGHVRGAFTGALRDKVGRFQAAHGGSIFLDEIGDVSPLIQLKLLRFLESREFERVGESATRSVDVRVMAATNADLPRKVAKGAFRADLYYRLKVLEVRLPPLRNRLEDIPLLVEHFLAQLAERYHKPRLGVEEPALHRLLDHPWPGNVRELKHCLEHAAIICREERIQAHHLPLAPAEQPAPDLPAAAPAPRRSSPDRESVLDALRRAG